MNAVTRFGVVGLCVAALFACSKPVPLSVGEKGIGPVTVATPFKVDAVAGLLPSRKVEATVSDNLQPGEHVIRVSDGDKALFELYPSRDGKTVESALILDASLNDAKGIHIGSTFVEAVPDGDTSDCSMGQGPKAGRLYCPQATQPMSFMNCRAASRPRATPFPTPKT